MSNNLQFTFLGKRQVRRALKKQIAGVMSVPVPRTNQQIRVDIEQMISSGKFDLGTPVLDNETQNCSHFRGKY